MFVKQRHHMEPSSRSWAFHFHVMSNEGLSARRTIFIRIASESVKIWLLCHSKSDCTTQNPHDHLLRIHLTEPNPPLRPLNPSHFPPLPLNPLHNLPTPLTHRHHLPTILISRGISLIAPPAEQLLGWVNVGPAGLTVAFRPLGAWVDVAAFAYVR